MKYNIVVENVKCHGCENSIKKRLSKFDTLKNISIDNESGTIDFELDESKNVQLVIDALNKIGYPLAGTGNNIHNIKSYVSCAIGRVQSND